MNRREHQIGASTLFEGCMDRDGHDVVAATPHGLSDRNKKNEKPPHFERRILIDRIKKSFSHGLTSHGALTEKVCLYGCSGLGKRTVAAQVAKEITQADGRRILWINGLTFETFVRDYCMLYHEFTGEHLPRGLGLAVALTKIKHVLEERRQEWLMVITDLGFFSDDEPELASSLPDRGHVLVTSDVLAYPPIANDTQPLTLAAPFSPLKFANNADEVYAKGLGDTEIERFARELCPDLSRISRNEFGIVQRWGHAVPLYLRITVINLQLLRMDFAAYRRFFERQFDHSQVGKYEKFGEYNVAWTVAMKIMWNALGDYDMWAQRLLLVLTVVASHPVPLRLLRRISTFSKSVADNFSPALDFLTSLGLVIIANEPTEPQVSIMHHDISRWIGKHARIRLRDELHRVILSWVSLLSNELASSVTTVPSCWGPMLVCVPYDINKSWSYFPFINAIATDISHVGVLDHYRGSFKSGHSQRTAVLNFLINAAETFISDRRVPSHAADFADEAFKVLLEMRYLLSFNEYQLYLLRIKHVQVKALMAANECLRAEQELRTAKRSLRMLMYSIPDPLYNNTASSQQVFQITSMPPLSHNAASITPSPASAGSLPTDDSSTSTTLGVISPAATPPLLNLTRRTDDLEAQLLLLQQRYSQAFFHVARLLRPEPDQTSLGDPYVLAQRYSWCATALSGQRQQRIVGAEALLWSHAAMCIWSTLDDTTRWGKGERMGVEVLAWVEQHALLLMERRKFKGALLFLPKLLDVWQELIPMGDGKVWRLARRLVECYVRVDMVAEAERVVERMLEILCGSSNGMNDLSGLGGVPSGGGYENETVGNGDGREMFWWMLFELATAYLKVGSVVVAEGVVRYCLGSWRRRHVGQCREIEIVDIPGASAEQLAKSKREQDEHNQKTREQQKERESTWKKSVPREWWALLIDVLVLQGKVPEPKKLVEELTADLDQDEPRHDNLEQAFHRRVDAYRLMIKIYGRAIWAEEDGCLREWKMLLGDSRDRFLLRRAVKAFGSVIRRVREKRDFASDIDLNLESHAKQSKILHLLDRNWGHKYGFSPKSRWEIDDYVEDVTTHPTHGQHHLCEKWHWCQCKKKRSRAWSIDYEEYVQKRFILEEDRREQQPKPLKQTTLDDWSYLIVPLPVSRPEGCREDCPCIDANIAGLAEQAALQAKLWTYTEPVRPHSIGTPKTRPRFKSVKDKANAHTFPGLDVDADRLTRSADNKDGVATWMWYQLELSQGGEVTDESYIIPTALDIPNLSITLVEDEEQDGNGLEELKEQGDTAAKYLQVPTDKWLSSEVILQLLDRNKKTKARQKKNRTKKGGRFESLYFGGHSRVQSEHIKPYLTMDEKTKAKYAERAKENGTITLLDEYYMPIETISDEAAMSTTGNEAVESGERVEGSTHVEDTANLAGAEEVVDVYEGASGNQVGIGEGEEHASSANEIGEPVEAGDGSHQLS